MSSSDQYDPETNSGQYTGKHVERRMKKAQQSMSKFNVNILTLRV